MEDQESEEEEVVVYFSEFRLRLLKSHRKWLRYSGQLSPDLILGD